MKFKRGLRDEFDEQIKCGDRRSLTKKVLDSVCVLRFGTNVRISFLNIFASLSGLRYEEEAPLYPLEPSNPRYILHACLVLKLRVEFPVTFGAHPCVGGAKSAGQKKKKLADRKPSDGGQTRAIRTLPSKKNTSAANALP
jgi:hypothetical protein